MDKAWIKMRVSATVLETPFTIENMKAIESAWLEIDEALWGELTELPGKDPGSSLASDLLEVFAQNCVQLTGQMKQAWTQKDAASLAKSSHSLKSSTGAIAAKGLHAVCSRIEKSAKAQQLEGLDVLIDALPEACQQYLLQARKRL